MSPTNKKSSSLTRKKTFASKKDRTSPTAGKDGSGNFSGKGDFASFDLLWYDLVSKTRALVGDSVSPLVDDITQHKDLLSKLQATNNQNVKKVDELERTVYNKLNKLTIFEEIYDKIARVEADRIIVEQRIENDHELILTTFKEHNFIHDNS